MALGERASLTVMLMLIAGTAGTLVLTSSWKREMRALLALDEAQQAQRRPVARIPEDRLQELYGKR